MSGGVYAAPQEGLDQVLCGESLVHVLQALGSPHDRVFIVCVVISEVGSGESEFLEDC